MKQKVGIWLDQKEAQLIRFKKGHAEVTRLESNIEDFHVVGGARSKTPWGPMDKVSENKALERKKHQFQQYFQRILDELNQGDELYLFGPAETKNKLLDVVMQKKALQLNVRKTDTADKMTQRQMIAQVRNVFGMHPSKS